MVLLTIRLFGDFAATDHRGDALSVGNRRTQALIVYLALKITGRTSFQEIAELIFGDETAQASARALVNDLRYALRFMGSEILYEDGDAIRFNREVVDVDAARFADLVAGPSINTIRRATDIYRGNLLEQFQSGIPSFDQWLAEKRLNYWRGAVAIFGRLLAAQIQAGWWEEAVETASRLLSLDPSQEVVHRTLMRLQLEQGRPDSALRRYQECADILRREHGREPGPETQRLHEEIQTALACTPAPREMLRNPLDKPVLILVVEDDLVSAALVESYLGEAGYEAIVVNDGAEALLELGKRKFELLLLDINVPTLNGLKLFEIMIQKGIETPALFVTGIPGADVEAQSLELGAAGFLRKPIRREVLLPRIRRILQRTHRGDNTARRMNE
ncbi:MAG TPA: BTAD domain-containing putative transcriptional regulator [Thermoanaerobaculia bacterium]|jgi:DNA-binding SARP family transcriptional activator